jgi:ribosomal protein S18 acetylase RimI-like enzyme
MWVWDLTVREDHWRRGIGRKLLDFARTRAETKGCAELWLLVSSINDKAVKLYQTFGMDFSGHLMSMPVRESKTPHELPDFKVEMTEFRSLSPADIPQLYELWEASSLPYKPFGRDRSDRLGRHLNQHGGGGWGAFYGQNLSAAALYSYDGRKGYIEHLATRPEQRRAGLAEAIVAASLQSLKEAGALVIAALIESANTPSRKLFESLGFVDSPSLCYYSIRDGDEA